MDHFKGASGSESDSHGIPWNESFEKRELKRLEFEKWRQEKSPDNHTPGEALPESVLQQKTTVTRREPNSYENFIERKRRRGPYSKRWGFGGI